MILHELCSYLLISNACDNFTIQSLRKKKVEIHLPGKTCKILFLEFKIITTFISQYKVTVCLTTKI